METKLLIFSIGFSFPQVIDIAVGFLDYSMLWLSRKKKKLMQILANLLQFGLLIVCFCLVAWEAYTCLNNYISVPTGTRIYFADFDTVAKPSISFCLTKELYILQTLAEGGKNDEVYIYYTERFETYNKSHDVFWGKETRLVDMISLVNISLGSNHWVSVWNDRVSDEATNKLFTKLYVPLVGNRLQFCYSLNLEKIQEFSLLRFGFRAEIQFALHTPSQLSSSGVGRLSAVNLQNMQNIGRKGTPPHQDTVYNLKFKYSILSLEASQADQLYDQCVESAALNAAMNTANCTLPINHSDKDYQR